MGWMAKKKIWMVGAVLCATGVLAAEPVEVNKDLPDPCAPIAWRGDTEWKNPVATNITRVTLDEVIVGVFSNSVTIRSAEAAVRAAQREVSLQRSAYWPTLSASASWQRSRTYVDAADNETDSYSASLNASWLLFDGFQRELELVKSMHQRNASEYAEQEVRRNLHQVISTVWFATILAQDRMDAAQQDIFFNEQMLEAEKEKYRVGVGRRSDILNFKVKLMEDVNTYFSQRLLFDSNITILERLLQTNGVLSVDTHRFVDPYPDELDYLDVDLEQQVAYARHIRADIRQQEETVAATKKDVNIVRGTRLPSVTLNADYGLANERSFDFDVPEEGELTAGVSMSWSLFSGFSSHHEVMQAQEQVLIEELALDQKELELREELTRLYKNFKNALHLYYNAALRRDAALEDRELVSLLYESDLVQVTRLNEVQKDSVAATEEFIKSRVRVGEAWEAILIATGRTRDPELSERGSTNTAPTLYIQDLTPLDAMPKGSE
jgi:outer membrane protein TolC